MQLLLYWTPDEKLSIHKLKSKVALKLNLIASHCIHWLILYDPISLAIKSKVDKSFFFPHNEFSVFLIY